MTTQLLTDTTGPPADVSPRRVALIAGLGLLVMAVLAPFAHFGVLETLVVRMDATATVENIVASEGLFRFAIAAFLVVPCWICWSPGRSTSCCDR